MADVNAAYNGSNSAHWQDADVKQKIRNHAPPPRFASAQIDEKAWIGWIQELQNTPAARAAMRDVLEFERANPDLCKKKGPGPKPKPKKTGETITP